ncbi:hypothetical protein GJ496_010477 [Pomphorhynchus laevis]|nr:hypothetical protein GJ496_010477 [Pomphorhynchus laevis]
MVMGEIRYLSNNRIDIIDEHAFDLVYNLVLLDLSYNKLQTIPDSLLRNCDKLKQLNLSNNFIRTFYMESFYTLTVLDLSNNQFENIDQYTFKVSDRLQEIYLQTNIINSVDPTTFNASSLQIIELSGNDFVLLEPPDNFVLSSVQTIMNNAYSGQVDLELVLQTFACTKQLYVSSSYSDHALIRNPKESKINAENTILNRNCHHRNMTKLVASHSFLVSINSILLSGINSIEYIDVSHNLIASVSEIVIKGLPRLRYLDLQYNRLISLDTACIDAILGIEYYKLRFNYILNDNPFSRINQNKDMSSIIVSGGDILFFKQFQISTESIIELTIRDSLIFDITDINFKAHLRRIIFIDNQVIINLATFHLSGCIEFIKIVKSNLQSISFNFDDVSEIVQLHYLDLSENDLQRWQTNKILNNLVYLNLDDNRLESFNSKMTPNIKLLSLARNNIFQIEGTFYFLESLILAENALNTKITNAIQLSNIVDINLSSILLMQIPEYLYNGLIHLRTLKLHNCMIYSLTNGMLSDSTQLKEIDLSHNILNDVNTLLQHRRHLKMLNVSRNAITSINLQTCPIIENIDLSSNRITSIMLPLINQIKIKYLNLSFNDLQSTDFLNFKKLSLLETLDLSHNRISSLDISGLKFAKLNRLDISYNILRNLDLTDDLILKLTEDSLLANNLAKVNIYFGHVDNYLPLTFQNEFFTPDNKRSIVVSGQDKCAIAEHLCNFICQLKVMERYWFNDQPSSCNQC